MGRPRIELSPEQLAQLEALAGMGAPQEEIAKWFGMSVDTLTQRFSEPLERGVSRVRSRLRMAQIQCALGNVERGIKPNPTMLIWLGKQLLGQADRFDVRNPGGDGFSFVLPEKEKKS